MEYELVDVDVAQVALLRQKDRLGVSMHTSPAQPGQVIEFKSSTPATPIANPSQSQPLVISTDGRAWLDHNQVSTYPNTPQVSLTAQPWPQFAGGCSATMIGRSTAISAAHCFHNGVGWLPKAWAIAVVQTSSYPYITKAYPSGAGGVTGCYWVTIPTTWVSGGQSIADDIAVIDFNAPQTCLLQPGNTTGWLPVGIGNTNDYASANSKLIGYDGNSPLPMPAHPYPSMLTRAGTGGAGTVYVDPSFNYQLLHYLDTTGGSSGGGMLMQLFSNVGDSTYYWVGDNAKEYSWINGARRLDWALWGWISNSTTEW